MADEKNKIVQNVNNKNALANAKKVSLPPLFARAQNAARLQAEAAAQAIELPNRIGLLLDVSVSMGGKSIENLKKAFDAFANSCNYSDTALAIAHFGYSDDTAHDVPLTTDKTRIMLVGMGLHVQGGTPMAGAMERIISSQPVTRCVMISDGGPTDYGWDVQARHFRDAGVPCDCVHISESSQGEDVMKQIAEITGGIYIKFKDTDNFAKFFSYLTPTGRLRLTSGEVSAQAIGADEMKFLGGK